MATTKATNSDEIGSVKEAFAEAVENLKISDSPAAAAADDAPAPPQLKEIIEIDAKDLQVEATGPFGQVTDFNQLNLAADILQGVYAKKFTRPSKVQETALPLIFTGQNLIAQSQNGTGKTAAFLLGMLGRIDRAQQVPQALCVCPTRELARQIHEVASELAKFTAPSINCAVLVKQTVQSKQRLTQHLVVGTPGTVLDAIKTKALPTRDLKIFVLDEADQMMEQQGFADSSVRLVKLLPKNAQILLFSATYEPKVAAFASSVVPNPNKMMLKTSELPLDSIRQYYFKCATEREKYEVLNDIYAVLTLGQCIVFVNTRKTADELHAYMTKAGHTVSCLHGGDMSPEVRDRVIDDFRQAKTKVLITTNVMARGIDVLQVSLVINFDMPFDKYNKPDPATYLHRIGRTGRWTRKGVAVNFVHDKTSEDCMVFIQKHYGRAIEYIPHKDLEVLEQKLKI
eukprot:TRINITY_DN8352_c0_g2_i1.p1 TRINITY_DN8352_c0_g2~~TRINITY_DN8352_c0_g2_i1.p1  ORF type:complete len:456 (+),score=112.55 TRINITY_DN8352_c0_g2_i1:44-1411(+)